MVSMSFDIVLYMLFYDVHMISYGFHVILYGFHVILCGFHMIISGFHLILYGFQLILHGFHLILNVGSIMISNVGIHMNSTTGESRLFICFCMYASAFGRLAWTSFVSASTSLAFLPI